MSNACFLSFLEHRDKRNMKVKLGILERWKGKEKMLRGRKG
jgi:hypothetical protein